MEDFNILCLIYDAAHNFIATNRPNEIKLFETFYPTKLPHDSFVSVYESGRESGIMTWMWPNSCSRPCQRR